MTDEWAEALDEQKVYYDERAGEYDDFWFRRRAYALEEPLRAHWSQDAADTMRFVADHARGDVLELACGTGIFTDVLRRTARSVHAVDASSAMLELNRSRTGNAPNIGYEQADLFAWRPSRTYDVVFFSFWLSHVPDDLFGPFWRMVGDSLAPGGVVAFVDSVPYPAKAVTGEVVADTGARTEHRTLADGRTFQIVKRYWEQAPLTAALATAGWSADVETTAHHLMLRGTARPAALTPA
ncbi:class I SAM-dependent methyltransferase [Calidifontibacter terrae]